MLAKLQRLSYPITHSLRCAGDALKNLQRKNICVKAYAQGSLASWLRQVKTNRVSSCVCDDVRIKQSSIVITSLALVSPDSVNMPDVLENDTAPGTIGNVLLATH